MLQVTDYSIGSITVEWSCPAINPVQHSEITEYFLDCLPMGLSPEEEVTLAPVPCTPALPPINPMRSHSHLHLDVHFKPQIDYIYQKYLDVKITTAIFSNLMPSAEYTIRGKSCSLSGWSVFCPAVVQKTQCYVPEPPDPVDIIKISSNGLLLAWRPPYRDNGLKVDHYQIELIDAKMAIPVMEEEESQKLTQVFAKSPKEATISDAHASGNDEASQLLTQKNLHTKRLPSAEGSGKFKPGVASRFHRLIKHKNLQYLFK